MEESIYHKVTAKDMKIWSYARSFTLVDMEIVLEEFRDLCFKVLQVNVKEHDLLHDLG